MHIPAYALDLNQPGAESGHLQGAARQIKTINSRISVRFQAGKIEAGKLIER
jgi:hypothetical protein